MEYFQVRYDSRVINYERKMFIRLTTDYSLAATLVYLVVIVPALQS